MPPMPPDSSAIANALIARLGADATLLALMPNGVYEDMAPPGSTRFVIVSQIIATDESILGKGRTFESALYLVEARALVNNGSVAGDVRAAAARIDVLLEDGQLTVPGFIHRSMAREEFIRGTEVDEVDPSIVWKRRGGRYRVDMFRTMRPVLQTVDAGDTIAAPGAILLVNVWFDRPMQIIGTDPITLTVQSSDPFLWPDQTLPLDLESTDLDLPDYPTFGLALLVFQVSHLNLTGRAGLTFTVSNASPRTGWEQLRDLRSAEPVVDTLGAFTDVIHVS